MTNAMGTGPSLAVMVDAAKVHGDPDLSRIAELVKTAIGFEGKRGDTVQVTAMPFVSEDVPEQPHRSVLGVPIEKADLMRLAEIVLVGLLGIVGLLTVLRPMVLRLTALPAAGERAVGTAALPGTATGSGALAFDSAGPAQRASGTNLLEDESMVNLAQIEGQMRASSIRRVAELVERHPDETLMIVRGWIGQESG